MSRNLIVGLPGRGTGPLTGGAELSVGAAIDGEERVGIILTGGSTTVVGGRTARTGVGVLFNWRLTLLGTWGFLLAMCHPTTGKPNLADIAPSFAGPWTLLIFGTVLWSSEQPSFQDNRTPFSTTWEDIENC